MKVSVRLPLTLAIMDGIGGVGDENTPTVSHLLLNRFKSKADAVNTVGQGTVSEVPREYMPVIGVETVFQGSSPLVSRDIMSRGREADGSPGCFVGGWCSGNKCEKNLESNYRKVPNISGPRFWGGMAGHSSLLN
jgi:two-component system chemotaxis sensor kinase CheA